MRFQSGCNKVVIELRVVQFWSEIILVISDQIALHSVQLPLFIVKLDSAIQRISVSKTYYAIQRIAISPVDRVIHHSNNWGQTIKKHHDRAHGRPWNWYRYKQRAVL